MGDYVVFRHSPHSACARVGRLNFTARLQTVSGCRAQPTHCLWEAPTKFALGCIFTGARFQFQFVLGDEQYGNGRAAGTPALVRYIRAVARLRPSRAIVQLDYERVWYSRMERCIGVNCPPCQSCCTLYWVDPAHEQSLFTQTGLVELRVTVISG